MRENYDASEAANDFAWALERHGVNRLDIGYDFADADDSSVTLDSEWTFAYVDEANSDDDFRAGWWCDSRSYGEEYVGTFNDALRLALRRHVGDVAYALEIEPHLPTYAD